MNKRHLSLTRRNALKGFAFTLPFCIGFIKFFLGPLFQSLSFAFSNVTVEVGGYITDFVGWENITYVLKKDTNFSTNLLASIKDLLWQVPVILIAALFFAILLNRKSHGKTLIRAIFFLPVIVSSGVIINIIQSDAAAANVLTGNIVAGGDVTQNMSLMDLLNALELPETVSEYFSNIVNNLFGIIWNVGVQMIIFLAGLQNIPPSLYEASSVEGATAWENFWMITIPMLAPMILVNAVYTVVDSFTSASNSVMLQVINNMNLSRLGWASAMALIYFVIIAVILALILFVFNRIAAKKL